MRNIKKFVIYSSIFAATAIAPSCSKFLEEEVVATLTNTYYNSEEGLESLVAGMYDGLRFHYNYEWAYATTNYGTDEFTNGGGKDKIQFNVYSGVLDAASAEFADVWNNMYANINTANIGIQKIPEVYAAGTLANTRLGECLFMRGFDYFKLVKQFGGVPLKLVPSESLELEFTRASAEEVYAQIIADLRRAAEILPATPAQTGRITKAAAEHVLAKVYLYRASELNASFSKSTDLDSAIYYGEQVINNSRYKLATDFNDIFKYTKVNDANETNLEIILAAQFDNQDALAGRFGNQSHLWFLSVYQNLPGMIRDIANGREFQRLRPTDYAMDIYDRENDSRFYKSFKTSYISNNANTLPKWTSSDAPSPELEGEFKFRVGDTAIVYIANSSDNIQYTLEDIQKSAPTLFVRYYLNGTNVETNFSESRYLSLSKYLDPFRTSVASQTGTRDGIIARIGETYLVVAEAYGRKGDYGSALRFINDLRARAGYAEGEARDIVYYKAEGISPLVTNTTKEIIKVTDNAFIPGTAEAAKELYPANVGSKEAGFIHFILNERARELMGEFHRWEDLSRTKTLLERVIAFNADAAPNIREKHLLRPIPLSFLNGIQQDGKPLTDAEKTQMQNPGW